MNVLFCGGPANGRRMAFDYEPPVNYYITEEPKKLVSEFSNEDTKPVAIKEYCYRRETVSTPHGYEAALYVFSDYKDTLECIIENYAAVPVSEDRVMLELTADELYYLTQLLHPVSKADMTSEVKISVWQKCSTLLKNLHRR